MRERVIWRTMLSALRHPASGQIRVLGTLCWRESTFGEKIVNDIGWPGQ